MSCPSLWSSLEGCDVRGGLSSSSVLVCLVSFSYIFLSTVCVPWFPVTQFFLLFISLKVGCPCLTGLHTPLLECCDLCLWTGIAGVLLCVPSSTSQFNLQSQTHAK